jgi:hypothetical protein
MDSYSKTAMERAMAKKITWWQAAEILGFSDRHLRRIRERHEEFGYESTPAITEACALRHKFGRGQNSNISPPKYVRSFSCYSPFLRRMKITVRNGL